MAHTTKLAESTMKCAECGQIVHPPSAFHPFLYCELFKLGHMNQENYLRISGFERSEVTK